MNLTADFVLLISCLIAMYALSLGVFALLRTPVLRDKRESLVFALLCLFSAAWALGPVFNPLTRAYGYITAVLLTNIAMAYTLLLTDRRLWRYLVPPLILCSLSVFILLAIIDARSREFARLYAVIMYPFLFVMNFIVYRYAARHRSRFLLALGVMTSIMILGGFYQTLQSMTGLPPFPAVSFGVLGFVCVAGYHTMLRGYLSGFNWQDYVRELESKERMREEQYTQLKSSNLESVIILSQAIEAKDPYTRGHCLRVREYARRLALAKGGFDVDRMARLEYSALLHDIGKIGIPGEILNKPTTLSTEEFEKMSRHPDIGVNILKHSRFFEPILPMMRHHHERYNGSGYPSRLRGEDIPLEARILAIGDVLDALVTDRPYRTAMELDSALAIMADERGGQFDPVLLDIFLGERLYMPIPDIASRLKLDF